MSDENWPLTRRAIEDSERATGADELDLTDDDEPERGKSLMQKYAELGWVDTGSGPGYDVPLPRPKLRPDRDKLS